MSEIGLYSFVIAKHKERKTMKAYVLVNIRTGEVKEVVKNLRRVQGVVEANMTFGPYDAVAVIETGDINEVGTILANAIQPIPGILETLTCLAVDV
jgi:DNA-binding Lrp family transcriptional regulator